MSDTTTVRDWLTGQLPTDWFRSIEVTVDREEIRILGTLPGNDHPATADEPSAQEAPAPEAPAQDAPAPESVASFRERTRAERIAIARALEARTGRTVSWGVRQGEEATWFTTASVPVMTRLRQPERVVLDTLVDAGVARSRSEALAWCVRLVGRHSDEWLQQLREAMRAVEELRAQGPA
jgi:hypothetical protein